MEKAERVVEWTPEGDRLIERSCREPLQFSLMCRSKHWSTFSLQNLNYLFPFSFPFFLNSSFSLIFFSSEILFAWLANNRFIDEIELLVLEGADISRSMCFLKESSHFLLFFHFVDKDSSICWSYVRTLLWIDSLVRTHTRWIFIL